MTTNETMSRDEARQALTEIQRITEKTKRSLANGPAGPLLILWGLIWMIGFSVTQFTPNYSGLAWGILIVIGSLSSWRAGVRYDKMVKKRDQKADADAKALGIRIGIFWTALFCFAAVWGFLLIPFELMIDADRGPELSRRIGAFMATIPMFAYVAGGMWFGRFFIVLGIAVTILTVIGFVFLPSWFGLWMAIVGGGALALSGFYVKNFQKVS